MRQFSALPALIVLSTLGLFSRLSAAHTIRDIPDDHWVPIYFESIDRFAGSQKIKSLRTASLAPDHLEARFWIGFGLGGLHGFVIKRESGKWSGQELIEDIRSNRHKKLPISPRSTWEVAWSDWVGKRLLALPDFSTLPKSNYSVTDGSSLVVEVVSEGKYRTYMYPNSFAFDNPECRESEALLAVLVREFKGVEIPPIERKFFSAGEIRSVAEDIGNLKYPISLLDFSKSLRHDPATRGFRSGESTILDNGTREEWPLTARSEASGYYALLVYFAKEPTSGTKMVERAEVIFYKRAPWGDLSRVPYDQAKP